MDVQRANSEGGERAPFSGECARYLVSTPSSGFFANEGLPISSFESEHLPERQWNDVEASLRKGSVCTLQLRVGADPERDHERRIRGRDVDLGQPVNQRDKSRQHPHLQEVHQPSPLQVQSSGLWW
jgi:hypothetical protein